MTKSRRQDGGEGDGEPLQNLILLWPLIPQGSGKARWQSGSGALETKGLGLKGATRVVIPPRPQTPLVAFLVLRKSRSFYVLRCRLGRGLPGPERRQES